MQFTLNGIGRASRQAFSSALGTAVLALGLFQAQPALASDPAVLTFATVGDSRQDPSTTGLTGQDAHWLQNSKVLARILAEARKKNASMMMFNGDMIMGYGDTSVPTVLPATADLYMAADLAKTSTQYAFWRGMIASTMEAGTYVVPVPGNHEVQCSTKVNKNCSSANGGKNALVANENTWRTNMGDLILDTTRFSGIVGQPASNFSLSNSPCPAGVACTDGTTTDQTQLTYSFDVGTVHFAIINTDAFGRDSHAPTDWLAADLLNAKNRGAKNFFVFGHKPAYTYFYTGSDPTKKSGLDVDSSAASAFWSVVQQYNATYFCGHEHIFNAMQPQGGTAWQVLVGSGGSPFDAPSTDPVALDHTYAYAMVTVHASGTVTIKAFGFPQDLSATTQIWSTTIKPVK